MYSFIFFPLLHPVFLVKLYATQIGGISKLLDVKWCLQLKISFCSKEKMWMAAYNWFAADGLVVVIFIVIRKVWEAQTSQITWRLKEQKYSLTHSLRKLISQVQAGSNGHHDCQGKSHGKGMNLIYPDWIGYFSTSFFLRAPSLFYLSENCVLNPHRMHKPAL